MYSYNQIYNAWLQVKTKASSGGIDKVNIDMFEQNETENLKRIEKKLKQKPLKYT